MGGRAYSPERNRPLLNRQDNVVISTVVCAERVRMKEITSFARRVDGCMGRLNLASLGLAVGAVGQCMFFQNVWRMNEWIAVGIALLPWCSLFILSLTAFSPVTASVLRVCALGALVWYIAVAGLCEAGWLVSGAAVPGSVSMVLARCLMYGGVLWFILLAKRGMPRR